MKSSSLPSEGVEPIVSTDQSTSSRNSKTSSFSDSYESHNDLLLVKTTELSLQEKKRTTRVFNQKLGLKQELGLKRPRDPVKPNNIPEESRAKTTTTSTIILSFMYLLTECDKPAKV